MCAPGGRLAAGQGAADGRAPRGRSRLGAATHVGGAGDLRRLWVLGPAAGRPYLGVIGRVPARTLAAELEVQPMVVAPPRAASPAAPWCPGFWITTGRRWCSPPSATLMMRPPHRRRLGRVRQKGPFWRPHAGFRLLIAAQSGRALRAGEVLPEPRTESRAPRTGAGTRRPPPSSRPAPRRCDPCRGIERARRRWPGTPATSPAAIASRRRGRATGERSWKASVAATAQPRDYRDGRP